MTSKVVDSAADLAVESVLVLELGGRLGLAPLTNAGTSGECEVAAQETTDRGQGGASQSQPDAAQMAVLTPLPP